MCHVYTGHFKDAIDPRSKNAAIDTAWDILVEHFGVEDWGLFFVDILKACGNYRLLVQSYSFH